MGYRKLTIDEARQLLIRMAPDTQALRDVVRKAYGADANTFMVWSNSEYNDEYFQNEYIFGAFDANGRGLDGDVNENVVLALLGIKNANYRTEDEPDDVRMLINLEAADTTINLYVQE